MKKIILAILLVIVLLVSIALLTVGPFYNLVIGQEVSMVESENTGEDSEENPITYTEVKKEVILGDKALTLLGLENYRGNHYIMTISPFISGLVFGLIFTKKIRKNKNKKGGDSSQIEKAIEAPVPEVYKNNIIL